MFSGKNPKTERAAVDGGAAPPSCWLTGRGWGPLASRKPSTMARSTRSRLPPPVWPASPASSSVGLHAGVAVSYKPALVGPGRVVAIAQVPAGRPVTNGVPLQPPPPVKRVGESPGTSQRTRLPACQVVAQPCSTAPPRCALVAPSGRRAAARRREIHSSGETPATSRRLDPARRSGSPGWVPDPSLAVRAGIPVRV